MTRPARLVTGAQRPSPTARLRTALVDHQGSAIVETAFGLAVLMAVAMILIWALSAGVIAARAAFTAREAARSLARGEEPAAVVDRAQRQEPGAEVLVTGDSSMVTVTVEHALLPGGLLRGSGLILHQSATAWRER